MRSIAGSSTRFRKQFPACERPFLAVATELGVSETELIARVDRLLDDGTLTRFGPLFNADRLGGAFMLAAMKVPPGTFDDVATKVNALPAVAHNYARDHAFNWHVRAHDVLFSTRILKKAGLRFGPVSRPEGITRVD